MARAQFHPGHSGPEVTFWACFAVVLALFTQALFPPQVMAAETVHGTTFVICRAGADASPIADSSVIKTLKAPHGKNGLQGLKCADCVLHSVTGIVAPDATYVPAVYAVSHAELTPLLKASPIKARAPPRPHSCGPPSLRI